ncbi:DNA-binding response regulator [Anaerocolumna cellulosilytica]|uniref:DNA-binding response regulator n=1 Tax=Anaerocolumna cellulosilytica TaxID=433286 RepID=A0A6S6QUE1_9FIRM|nr:LytTR family DNA-binding domain-containing protein [Anaerocolumna cellulosilytica]MBB5193861.1 DNA-binding LytR/AlgR family response regulator [Anaerocolumna cellulosilytica]BCJ94923.1 DNA-binding response regulator [Anaerocolumna cellulosilytica]
MFRIAVCHKKAGICLQIENVALDFKKNARVELEIDLYNSGEELLRFISRGEDYDQIFLGMDLGELNGVDFGRIIREEFDNQTMQIVYMSTNDKDYRELIEIRPMHFLSLPIYADKIIKDIKTGMKLTDKMGETFSYRRRNEVIKKPIKNILYFESMNRQIRIVTVDGEDVFYGKLEDVYNQVKKHRFMGIHKSFVVNYAHVMTFKYDEVILFNSTHLPISQPRRKQIRELQLVYHRES